VLTVIVVVAHVAVSLLLVLLILLHSGKGSGLSDMFGGGMGSSAAGSTVMERNLDRRIEAVVPIEAPDLQKRLQALLDLALMDDANTWTLQADGAWARVPPGTGVSLQGRLRQDAMTRAQARTEAVGSSPARPPAVGRRYRWWSPRQWRRLFGGRRHPSSRT